MRRYLFLIAIAFVAVVIFFENAGLKLSPPIGEPPVGEHGLRGTVRSIEKSGDCYKIRVKLDDRGGTALIRYYEELEKPWALLRNRIKFDAELTVPSAARNPHCFDYRRYLLSEGIMYTGTARSFLTEEREYSLYERYIRYLEKQKIRFCELLGGRLRGTVMGVVFGDTSYLSEDVYEAFRRNGTAHILAVSGLHIGIFYAAFKKINGRRRNIFGFIIFTFMLLSYGSLASWRPSVIRATVMIIMSLAARIFCLRYDRLTAVAFIAVILIAVNPYTVYSMAFQMSFLAVISIDIFTKILPPGIPETVSTTLAVNFALILYQTYVFNYISPVSLILNIPVIFISGFFVPLAVACFISYCLFGITAVFMPTLTLLSDILIKINEISYCGGKTSVDAVSPPAFFVVFLSLTAFSLCSETFEIYRLRGEKKKIVLGLIFIIAVSSAAGIFSYNSISHDDMVFIDVGQGSATHIRNGGFNILIDGGGSYRYNIGKNTLKQYLLKNGEAKVDLALATHKDMDHYKGLRELADCFNVRKLLDEAIMGDEYIVSGNLRIVTLWPKDKADALEDENDNSSVFMITHKGVRTMITGDLGAEGELKMIEHYRKSGREEVLDADILNVGHHGSKNSTSEELLDVVSPEICIIQVGKNNYGHPSQEVLDRIRERGIAVFRNDECGAIGVRLKNGGIEAVHRMIDDVG